VTIHGLSTIRLFEAEPELLRFLAPEDAARASQVRLPVHAFPRGTVDLGSLLGQTPASGAFILEGMLLAPLRLGTHRGLRLLGPGDAFGRIDQGRSIVGTDPRWRAPLATKLVLLDRELLLAVRRWPGLAVGLQAQISERSDRLTAQLLICQMPRVADRLLALLWLVADSWGQVTADGTLVPVPLTHAMIGSLIGARRATVTLALGALARSGAISREPRGWLLHRQMPAL
jgi:CRP-like cAMP-binding protein